MIEVDDVLARVAEAEREARAAAIAVGQHVADAASYPHRAALVTVIAANVVVESARDLAKARLAGALADAQTEATAILTGAFARAEAAVATVAASARELGVTAAELAAGAKLPWSIRWAPAIVLGSISLGTVAVFLFSVRAAASPEVRKAARALLL